MLEIKNLSVSFSRYTGMFRQDWFPRLWDIDLRVSEGEIVALIGHSGAGKSLLAHAVLGLLPQNARVKGDICLHDRPLTAQDLHQVRGGDISLLPQQITHLDPTARVGSLVRWSARRAGKSVDVHGTFAKVGLPSEGAHLFSHQLSGGMARRVLMAQAISGGAKVLIADEPTAGLDQENCDTILKNLRQHADAGGAVLLITHDLMSVLPYANHIAILNEGKMVGVFPTSDFSGSGDALSGYARAMWCALPGNGFTINA